MPLFMDVHSLGGEVAVGDVAKAHMADLQEQANYDVNYLRYWVDEGQGKIFCLVEAPSADAANTVHREAHGLVAEDPTRGTARERWWRAEGFSFDVVDLDAESRTSAEAIQRHQVATRAAHQLAWIERQHDSPPEWHDAALSSESTLRMTAEEAAALHAAVGEVLEAHLTAARERRRTESDGAPTLMMKVYYLGFPLPEDEDG